VWYGVYVRLLLDAAAPETDLQPAAGALPAPYNGDRIGPGKAAVPANCVRLIQLNDGKDGFMRVNRYLRKPIRNLTDRLLPHPPDPLRCRPCGPRVFFGGADGV
jgi:hypothetical protein